VVVPGTHSFYDPRLGIVRSFETREALNPTLGQIDAGSF
jgi:hypothetical protein